MFAFPAKGPGRSDGEAIRGYKYDWADGGVVTYLKLNISGFCMR